MLHSLDPDGRGHKEQVEALRRSEEFLDRAGKLAGVGGWELDLVSGVLTWSAETYRILGMPLDYQPVLEEGIDFFTPEARPVLIAALEKASAGGGGYDLELPVVRADGRHIWTRAIAEAEFRDGKPIRLTGAFQDITAQVAERLELQRAKERVTLATDSGGIGIWDWDLVNGATTWDEGTYRHAGIEPGAEPVNYALWKRLLHPEDAAAAEEAVRESLEGSKHYQSEYRVIWPDGSVHHLRAAGRVTRDENGRAVRVVGANWDVTESRRLTAELAEQHELLRVTLQSIGDGVITSDARGHVAWLNPAAERMTGWSTAEAVGRPLAHVFHILNQETRKPAENPVAACLARGQATALANQTLLVSRSGEEFGIEDSAAPIRDRAGELLGVVLVFHDVTEQRRLSGEMTHRATHDALTGLVNRAEFEHRLSGLLQRAQADRSRHALLYVDLDQFKIVNDTCGHAVGDQLLRQVSGLLSEIVRSSDTLARLGGDEFAVLLEHCPEPQALRLAQQVCDRLDDFRFVHDERRFRIGASIGLVPVDDRWAAPATLLQAADTSCYAAKEAGRNRVHVWFDTDQTMRARHGEMQWANRLEQALDDDRFQLFAQRLRPLQGNETGMHAEVLLRMVDHDGSLIPPGAFLPAAERFHLASRIDRWVLGRAILWMHSAPSLDLIGCLNVNLSGQSVGDRAFHRWAIERLAEAGPEICRKLCVEITETAVVTNLADAALFIQQLHAVHVRVALDDFGAGASSFGYLKSMPVDSLKIDGQFIRDIVGDPFDEAAVRCFVDVARVARMSTVAEFVDNPAVLERLFGMGIDFAQGFLIHRPAPIDELLGLELASRADLTPGVQQWTASA